MEYDKYYTIQFEGNSTRIRGDNILLQAPINAVDAKKQWLHLRTRMKVAAKSYVVTFT